MRNYKIALFAYNFPHRKTQDFILRLIVEGYNIDTIIAADKVKLNIPKSTIKTKVRHQALIHPSEIAKRFDINYLVLPHNSSECKQFLVKKGFDIGVIAGARILKEYIIEPFNLGIINFHPGLIPEARGLDALLWSIYNNVPLGITAHVINKKIDAGKILIKKSIPVYHDDTIFDLSERLYEIQLDLLSPSIDNIIEDDYLELVDSSTHYNRKMPPELEKQVLGLLKNYISKFSEKMVK